MALVLSNLIRDYQQFPNSISVADFILRNHVALLEELQTDAPKRYPFICTTHRTPSTGRIRNPLHYHTLRLIRNAVDLRKSLKASIQLLVHGGGVLVSRSESGRSCSSPPGVNRYCAQLSSSLHGR